jgi:hypothetical protein
LRALWAITFFSEEFKKDKVIPGKDLNPHLSSNMAGSYLLFRGAQMKDEWLQPFIKAAGGPLIALPGNNSCSYSLSVALQYACDNAKKDHIPTVFIIVVHNYTKINGVAMNNEALTAYP